MGEISAMCGRSCAGSFVSDVSHVGDVGDVDTMLEELQRSSS